MSNEKNISILRVKTMSTTVRSSISASTNLLPAIKRIKIRHKLLKLTAYKLPNQETVVTTRQMALSVRLPEKTAKEFMRKNGLRPWKVLMPNRCVADGVPLSIAAAYWKHINELGKGNALTKLGQEILADYLTN